MIWKHVKDYDTAVEQNDEKAAMLAAHGVVQELKKSPFSIIFRPTAGPDQALLSALAMIASKGEPLSGIKHVKLHVHADELLASAEVGLPGIIGIEKHLEHKELADRLEASNNKLKSVNIRTVIEPITPA